MPKDYVSGAAFRRWVAEMCDQFDNNKLSTYVLNGNTTYVYLRSKIGKARCNPTDTRNEEIGIAYAWARCTGQQEYYNEEDIEKPEIGDWVLVKFADNSAYRFKLMAEGVDNYCFKDHSGHLIVRYKDRVKSMTKTV